ncbi:MAG: class I SAM-dependent methyltransferase [Gammaproteobacteria bacterium]|nr:class I SAM-dependent methyltransferase [Gammaproteobacteria bacterium]
MKDALPLYTYPSIEFIENHINNTMSVFEYGTGGSTFWWAKHVKRVVACDHSKRWYEKILTNEPQNVEAVHVELIYGGDYCRTAAQYPGEFDIIVVDGRDRNNVAQQLLPGLKPDGVIIWDNSDTERYKHGLEYIESLGYKRINFVGTGPYHLSESAWETCIFYKEDNCMGISF